MLFHLPIHHFSSVLLTLISAKSQENMEPHNNKTLLVIMFCCCIVLFNHARAICVPRNQSDKEPPSSYSSTSKSQPPPSSVSTPKSQLPPSPPPPPSASVPATPAKSQPPPSPPPPNSASKSVSPTPPKSQPQPSPPPPPPPPPNTASVPPSPPKSQPPPSPPPPNTASAPVPPTSPQETPDSSAEAKLPTIQNLLPSLSLNVKPVSDPHIKSLCDKTDLPALCLTIIAPFFNGKSDVTSVIEMLIKAGTEQTKQAIATAAKMATESKSDPRTLSRLDDCKEIYDDALDNLQEAMDAIPLKDVGTIATMVSAAISDYGTCDDGFTGQPNPIPEGVSPMAKINENLMNIAGIILALVDLLP